MTHLEALELGPGGSNTGKPRCVRLGPPCVEGHWRASILGLHTLTPHTPWNVRR